MALFYGHAPAAGHAPYEEERNPSTQMVDRKLVVSNEQESQASLFVCQEINSEVKNLRMEVASSRQSTDQLKANNGQDANKPTSKKLPKGLSVRKRAKLVLK